MKEDLRLRILFGILVTPICILLMHSYFKFAFLPTVTIGDLGLILIAFLLTIIMFGLSVRTSVSPNRLIIQSMIVVSSLVVAVLLSMLVRFLSLPFSSSGTDFVDMNSVLAFWAPTTALVTYQWLSLKSRPISKDGTCPVGSK
jgi:hypothetical protein